MRKTPKQKLFDEDYLSNDSSFQDRNISDTIQAKELDENSNEEKIVQSSAKDTEEKEKDQSG